MPLVTTRFLKLMYRRVCLLNGLVVDDVHAQIEFDAWPDLIRGEIPGLTWGADVYLISRCLVCTPLA
jgi:hypothetical protein